MPPSRRVGHPVSVRPTTRPRVGASPSLGTRTSLRPSGVVGPFLVSQPTIEAARRIAESVIIALVSSAGLYLVGSVYIDAYYSRPRSA